MGMDKKLHLVVFLIFGNVICDLTTFSNKLLLRQTNIHLNQLLIKQTLFNFNDLSKTIQSLIIENSIIEPSEIFIMNKYESLSSLSLKNCILTGFAIKMPMDSLINLDLSFNLLKEVDFLANVDLKSLQNLNLRDNRISSFQKKNFLHLRNINVMDISNNNIKEIDFSIFCELQSLNNLKISFNVYIHNNHCGRILITKDTIPPMRQFNDEVKDNNANNQYKRSNEDNEDRFARLVSASSERMPTTATLSAHTDDTVTSTPIVNQTIENTKQNTKTNISVDYNNLVIYIIFPIVIIILAIIITLIICRNKRNKAPVKNSNANDSDSNITG